MPILMRTIKAIQWFTATHMPTMSMHYRLRWTPDILFIGISQVIPQSTPGMLM